MEYEICGHRKGETITKKMEIRYIYFNAFMRYFLGTCAFFFNFRQQDTHVCEFSYFFSFKIVLFFFFSCHFILLSKCYFLFAWIPQGACTFSGSPPTRRPWCFLSSLILTVPRGIFAYRTYSLILIYHCKSPLSIMIVTNNTTLRSVVHKDKGFCFVLFFS